MKPDRIDSDRTYFVADHHFGHEGVIRMSKRPFASVDEMDRYMIQAWNDVVRADCHVWHLGDFAHRADRGRAGKIFAKLNGIKHLVRGNHDPDWLATKEFGWASVDDRKVLNAGGQLIVLDHYPSREWVGWWNGSLQLHGHTHNNLPSSSRSFDVGVDALGYVPATIHEIRARMAQLPNLDFRHGVEVDWLVAPRE
ncbi:MAG TPA: hypothetical protein VL017_02260, partial [Devosia sp.]|nr:hypothetical protein [Devosia sp.]